jgi:hypothetical protein
MLSAGAATGGVLCWLRALVLGFVALAIGASAHVAAGGTLPAVGALLALLGVVTIAVAPMLRSPAPTRRVVVLLVTGEAFIHLVLSVTSPARTVGPEASSPGTAPLAGGHHTHDALVQGGSAPHSGWLVQPLTGTSGQHLLMAEAHLAAAVAVGLWLAAGERALWTLLRCGLEPVISAARTITRQWSVAVVSSELLTPAAAADLEQPFVKSLGGDRALTRRGPPAPIGHGNG